jgi:hypothetical protein
MAQSGSAYVYGTQLFFIDSTGTIKKYDGNLIASGLTTAKVGSVWLENGAVCYIDESNNKRSIPAQTNVTKSGARPGSLWVENTLFAWINESNTKIFGHADVAAVAHSNAPGSPHSNSGGNPHSNSPGSSHTDNMTPHGNVPSTHSDQVEYYANSWGVYANGPHSDMLHPHADTGAPHYNAPGTPHSNYPATPHSNYPGTAHSNYPATAHSNYPGSPHSNQPY